MRYLSILFLICTLVSSCDPIASELFFTNNSDGTVYVQTFFIQKDRPTYEIETLLTRVEQNETIKSISVVDIKSLFERYSDSTLTVVFFKDYSFLQEDRSKIKNRKADSLLEVGDYMIREYSYSDLQDKSWQILYPDDGFTIGESLRLNN